MLCARTFGALFAVILLSLHLLPSSHPAVAQEHANLVDPKPGPPPTLEQVVEKLTLRAEKLACNSDDCKLLVLNFASTSGSAVMLDTKLADQLATIFAKTLPKGKVIERSRVREFLARERIPYSLLKSDAARRWLGNELGATTVVSGDLHVSGSVPQVMFTLFDVQDPEKVEYFGTELPATAYSPGDLQASEPFGPREPPKTTESGAAVYRAGVAGVGSPACSDMPNPPYTDAAREAKISGVVLVDAIVTLEGTVESPLVIKGLPGGLNDVTRKTMETWRCKPALKDNQPVATVVQFEVNFRLYENH
jgi:Gram-negative bacterial TonB protein C-terminal